MKTIQIEIEDGYLDNFLSIIDSLKDGMIKKFEVKDDSMFRHTQIYFQHKYDEIQDGKVKLIPFEDGLDELDEYIDSIK